MAKILISSYSGYGFWMSLRLQAEGHSVDINYTGPKDNNTKYVLDGLIKPPSSSPADYSKYDLVLFDLTGRPQLAEQAMKLTSVLGDGNFNSEMEENRILGIEIMEECGINVPVWEAFEDLADAKKFIKKTQKTYVFKPNGGQDQDTASTYVSRSAQDLLDYLDKLGSTSKGVEFILQEVVAGTEISTEAWFNGEDFYLINCTLEEKKFMDQGRGPNTGCSGNMVWVYDELNPPAIFREGLSKMKDFLKEVGYKGMIDLNTIVSDREIYGLEWTPRFGYDAACTLFNLIKSDLGDFLVAVAKGVKPTYQINNAFAAGVRVSIPPYPSEIEGKHPEEIPIKGIEEDDIVNNFYLFDCCAVRDDLFTVGVNGFIGLPIYNGPTIAEVFHKVYSKIHALRIPDLQYRNDIEACIFKRHRELSRQGWLS